MAALEIHETLKIAPQETIPEASRCKGYADYTVIGLRFQPHNVRYRLEVWVTPDGRRLTGQLPATMAVLDGHCSPELVGYILHQHHHAHVPQGLIWEQLQEGPKALVGLWGNARSRRFEVATPKAPATSSVPGPAKNGVTSPILHKGCLRAGPPGSRWVC